MITAVDVPAVVPATRRAVRDAGLQRQFRFLAGDLFRVELERGVYDLAIAGNLCHLFDEAANRRLLGRVHSLAAYLGWLRDAGFRPPERHLLADQAQAVLLVACKPAA